LHVARLQFLQFLLFNNKARFKKKTLTLPVLRYYVTIFVSSIKNNNHEIRINLTSPKIIIIFSKLEGNLDSRVIIKLVCKDK